MSDAARLCSVDRFRRSVPARKLRHARVAESRAGVHEVRSHPTTGRRVRLSVSHRTAGRAAPGSLLCELSGLRTHRRVGAPNGASGGTSSATPRTATLNRARAALLLLAGLVYASPVLGQARLAVVRSELVFQNVSFASAHASTIAETPSGLVAAWFGGSFEGAPDVSIWVARQSGGRWSPPIAVANGVQADGSRQPCWNPVLYQVPNGPLTLFYKVGPSPRAWWGMVTTSANGGRTWATPRRLPDGILGPIKNKPIRLRDGTLVSPSSTESGDSPPIWRVHFERSSDAGKTWTRITPASNGAATVNAIQPTILTSGDSLEALVRTPSRRIYATWSLDGGKSWSPLEATGLPNPNAGIDAVTLKDGRHLLVYNNSTTARTPLSVAISTDARTWTPVAVVSVRGAR